MSKKMETIKQQILTGEIAQPEFAVAKANNVKLPEADRLCDEAVAWRVAKMLRRRVTGGGS